MGNVLKTLFMPVGLGGMGVDFTKKKKRTIAPTYDADAEKNKVAMQEAEANKRRALSETQTVRTSALGNASGTQTQKKTLLGG